MTVRQDAPAAMPRRPGSGASRLASVIIALACIVVAGIAVHITDGISGDVVRTVDVKEPGRLDSAIVTVTGVRAGSAVVIDPDEHFASKGMILAVTVRVEAPGQKYTVGGLGGITLHASDRTYSAFGPNSSISAQAGFARTGDLLFEVDPGHIDGAYLELYREEFIHVTPQKLHVRLGITRRNAADWAAAAKGRTLHSGDSRTEPLP